MFTTHRYHGDTSGLQVLISLKNQLYALDAVLVQEMICTPAVDRVPETPGYVRGVINLRGSVIPLIDLRELLGMQSAPQERTAFREMLQQREQDHKHWLDELAACVLEVRPFTLATDPTQCAFGKWYGGYHPPNISVSSLVHKMDAPHRAIHAIARQATELVAAGKTTEAQALIERTRTTALAALLPLFAELSRLIDETDREVCVVLGTGVKRVAVAVDAVESVERFAAGSETSLDHVPGLSASGLAQSIGRRAHGNGLVTILDIDRLLRTDVENMNCNWSEVQPAA